MVFVLSFVILTSAIVNTLAGPIAVPAPFPGGIGPDGTRYKTAYKCEGEDLEISCSADQTIKIIRANFGRFSIAICNKHGTTDMSVNCMSPASNRVMKKKCDGQRSCSITIGSDEFGDPCPNTPKYLEVHYGCVPRSSPTTKKPLPAWFLQGGSTEQLWETRIPDPPEGFEPEPSSSETSRQEAETSTVPETRIPITTPTGTTETSTTTTVATSAAEMTSSQAPTSHKLQSPAAEERSVDIEPELPQVSLEIVEIPEEERPHHCAPATARNLAWNWTRAGDTAIQPCPPGTTGLARWTCSELRPAAWSAAQPDMSDCRSLSMTRLETKVEGGDLENVLSASLAHHTRSQVLYGGDVESAAAIMKTLSNRLAYLLQTQGDKLYNRGQYIQEVLLNLVRAASNLLDPDTRLAWADLPTSRQVKAAAALMQALEENAFLFVEVTKQEEVLVESSHNILMSASIMEIGRLTNGTRLPVSAYEEPYGSLDNSITVPFTALWAEARDGVANLVHFSFRNLHQILGRAEVDSSLSSQAASRASLSVNSRVISGSLGRGRAGAGRGLQFPNTVTVELRHLAPVTPDTEVVCVTWEREMAAWTRAGCSLLSSTETASTCSCDSMGAFALLLAPAASSGAGSGSPGSAVPIVTLQIVTYCVAAVSVLCVVLILVKFRRNIQKLLYKTPCLNQEEKHACNPRTRSCLNMGLSAEKNASHNHTLQGTMMQRALNPCSLDTKAAAAGEAGGQGGEVGGSVAGSPLPHPAPGTVYRTQFSESGSPVMVTLNPYSSQLVDNLNRMMGPDQLCYDTAMNPQLARLTATLRKKQQHRAQLDTAAPGAELQLVERVAAAPGCMFQEPVHGRVVGVAPSDVVFRAVSPHGHVYWEINPTKQQHRAQQSHGSSSTEDTNTNSDLQNISDFSDSDELGSHGCGRAASEMSRQSSSRFSESRPLIYSGSSTSTSPGHSAALDTPTHHAHHAQQPRPRARPGPGVQLRSSPWVTASPAPGYPVGEPDVYAYAATDFAAPGHGSVSEQLQSQVQIRDLRAVPVSVKSKDYIMAKIADYTERHANQV